MKDIYFPGSDKAIRMAPAIINTAPVTNCHVIFSFRKITDKTIAITKDDRSIVATYDAGPIDKALYENKVERVVANPARINNIHALFSISFIPERLPWIVTMPQVIQKINTLCIANARLESTFFNPAFVSTITKAADIAASTAHSIHIIYIYCLTPRFAFGL